MKGTLRVLSVERSVLTAVPFVVYGRQAYCSVCGTQCCDCSTICSIWKIFGVSEGGENMDVVRGDIWCVRGRGEEG